MNQIDLNQAMIDFSRIGNVQIVEILLEYGADVHAGNDWVLRYASNNGHYEVVELLESYGGKL
jgi:ankyrin repeat protein